MLFGVLFKADCFRQHLIVRLEAEEVVVLPQDGGPVEWGTFMQCERELPPRIIPPWAMVNGNVSRRSASSMLDRPGDVRCASRGDSFSGSRYTDKGIPTAPRGSPRLARSSY